MAGSEGQVKTWIIRYRVKELRDLAVVAETQQEADELAREEIGEPDLDCCLPGSSVETDIGVLSVVLKKEGV